VVRIARGRGYKIGAADLGRETVFYVTARRALSGPRGCGPLTLPDPRRTFFAGPIFLYPQIFL